MAFAWYGNQSTSEACRFGALAVIVPLIERMNVVNVINQHVPADPQAEFDYGTTLSLLMAVRLYSPMALSNVAEWAGESGADILWDMPPEKINDDRLGRALDAFFRQRHSILAHLALHVSREFDVPLFGHTVDGNQNGRKAVDEQLALICKHLRSSQLTMISDRGTFSVGHLLRLGAGRTATRNRWLAASNGCWEARTQPSISPGRWWR